MNIKSFHNENKVIHKRNKKIFFSPNLNNNTKIYSKNFFKKSFNSNTEDISKLNINNNKNVKLKNNIILLKKNYNENFNFILLNNNLKKNINIIQNNNKNININKINSNKKYSHSRNLTQEIKLGNNFNLQKIYTEKNFDDMNTRNKLNEAKKKILHNIYKRKKKEFKFLKLLHQNEYKLKIFLSRINRNTIVNDYYN